MEQDNRRVEYAEGQLLGDKYGMKFIEASAKEGTNIQKIFEILGKELKNKLEREEKEGDSKPNNQQLKVNANSEGQEE